MGPWGWWPSDPAGLTFQLGWQDPHGHRQRLEGIFKFLPDLVVHLQGPGCGDRAQSPDPHSTPPTAQGPPRAPPRSEPVLGSAELGLAPSPGGLQGPAPLPSGPLHPSWAESLPFLLGQHWGPAGSQEERPTPCFGPAGALPPPGLAA